jgi:type I restriction enzyme, S subunit
MNRGWSEAELGEVLVPRAEYTSIDPERRYREVTVAWWGKGVRLRRVVLGAEIAASERNVVRTGDFIISKIDARHGAYGFVPPELDCGIVTTDFPVYQVNTERMTSRWLYWLTQQATFARMCELASEGSTRRVRVSALKFDQLRIPLPPLSEQQRIVAHLDSIESRLMRAKKVREQQERELQAMLRSAFHNLLPRAEWVEMSKVAPIVRREVALDEASSYPELGIRSFGRGTFHKPPVLGLETTKRLFEIHAGDLVFSNVFAWEGAIAVARPEDHCRLGSHRFISCVCDSDRVLAECIQFYFLTPDGLEKIRKASPGGAGRNRTLGIEKLGNIKVPVVQLATQLEFKKLLDLQSRIHSEAAQSSQRSDALVLSLVDRIFKVESP